MKIVTIVIEVEIEENSEKKQFGKVGVLFDYQKEDLGFEMLTTREFKNEEKIDEYILYLIDGSKNEIRNRLLKEENKIL